MLRIPLLVTLLLATGAIPVVAQSVEAKCYAAITTGDATINCQKALVKMQRRQLEILTDIKRLIARGANRSTARTVTNTGLTIQKLEQIARILSDQGARPKDTLFVTDATVLSTSAFTCESDRADECAQPARKAANNFCVGLGYRGQQAHAFDGPKGADRAVRISWVACRP